MIYLLAVSMILFGVMGFYLADKQLDKKDPYAKDLYLKRTGKKPVTLLSSFKKLFD